MILPAVGVFAPAAASALSTAMQIAKWLAIAGIGKSIAFGGLDLWAKQRLNPKTLDLQKATLAAEMEAAKSANEANRQDTARLLGLASEEKQEQRLEKSRDRQMQLLATLLSASAAFRQQASQTFVESKRTAPPMAMTTLMRG